MFARGSLTLNEERRLQSIVGISSQNPKNLTELMSNTLFVKILFISLEKRNFIFFFLLRLMGFTEFSYASFTKSVNLSLCQTAPQLTYNGEGSWLTGETKITLASLLINYDARLWECGVLIAHDTGKSHYPAR